MPLSIEQLRAAAAKGRAPTGGVLKYNRPAPVPKGGYNSTGKGGTKNTPKKDKQGFDIITPSALKEKYKELKRVHPQYADMGDDVIRGIFNPVESVLKVLDFGRKPIQEKVFGATTEEMRDDPTAGHDIWKNVWGKDKGKNPFFEKKGEKGVQNWDDNLNRFVADVITSPSSFIGGPAAGLGRTAVKKALGEQVVKHGVAKGLKKEAAEELAQQITGKVIRGAKAKEAAATVGTIRNRMAKNPVTKDIALPKHLKGGIGIVSPLPGKDNVARSIIPGSVTSKITGPVGQRIAGSGPAKYLLRHTPGREAALSGYLGLKGFQMATQNDQLRKNVVAEGSAHLYRVKRAFGNTREGEAAFDKVLTGQAVAMTPKQEKAVQAFREFFWEKIPALKAQHGLEDGVLDKYTPLLLSKNTRELLGRNVPPTFARPASKAHARILAKGLGDTAAEVNAELRKQWEAGDLPEFDDLFKSGKTDVFSESSYENWQRYLDTTMKRSFGQKLLKDFDDEGIMGIMPKETKSGLRVDILQKAGFADVNDAVALGRYGRWNHPNMLKLKEIDPEQFASLQAVTNLKVAKANSATTAAALKTKLGPAQAKVWTNISAFTNPKFSPLAKQRWVALSARTADMTDEAAEAAHINLLNDLREAGHAPIDAVGKTVKWGDEKNFLVPGMTAEEAQSFLMKYKQEAAETNHGTLFADGTLDPVVPNSHQFDRPLKTGGQIDDEFTEILIDGEPVRFTVAHQGVRVPLAEVPSGRYGIGGMQKTLRSIEKTKEVLTKPTPVAEKAMLVLPKTGGVVDLNKLPVDFKIDKVGRKYVHGTVTRMNPGPVDRKVRERLQRHVSDLQRKLDKDSLAMDNYSAGYTDKGEPWPLDREVLDPKLHAYMENVGMGKVDGTIFPQLNGKPIPQHLAKELQENFASWNHMSRFQQDTQKVINFWKQSVTGPFPAFHMRNAMGGWFNNFIGGVRADHLIDFERMHRGQAAGKVWRKYGNRTTEDILESMQKGGFAIPLSNAGRRQAGANILTEYQTPEMQKMMGPVRQGVHNVNHVFQSMSRAPATVIEDGLRGSAFLKGLQKFGGDDDLALDFVFYRHGDYSHLSKSEQNIRTFFPFYKWMRTNIPFQLQSIVDAPGRYQAYGRFVEQFQGQAPEDQDSMYEMPANQMADERGGIRSPFDSDRMLFQDLPIHDLNMFNSVAGAGKEVIGRSIFGNVVSAATGHNLLSGKPTKFVAVGPLQKAQVMPFKKIFPDKFRVTAGGELRVDQRLIFALNTLNPASRVTSTFDSPQSEYAKANPDPLGRMVSKGLGLNTQKIDPELQRGIAYSELDNIMYKDAYREGFGDKVKSVTKKEY